MVSTTNATLDAVLSCVPYQGIDFGYCGIDQETTRTFTLSNPTSTTVRFTVQSEEKHYTLSCNSGK